MRKMIVVALGLAAGLGAVSWAQSPAGVSAADIETFNANFAAAWARGDGEAIARSYTEDAVRIGTGQETMMGRAAIQKYFAGTLAGPSKGSKIALRVLGTRPLSSDVAVVYGTFDVTGPAARSGRYLNTIVRQQGGWLIASSGVVVDQPPAR
jgi:uncharacterized protein (TIGR02246 family)